MFINKDQQQFSIPKQTLKTLSFCEPAPRHLAEWIENLPMANLGESSRQLYHAIIELNQLNIDPDTRIKLNELLYKPLQVVIKSLSKHYLNQPVVLPPKALKVARLAFALDNHLMVAYKIVIQDRARLNQALLSNKHKKVTALAIYRAMSILTNTLVRSCQLYTPALTHTWSELHQLYLIAESNDLLELPIEDPDNRFLSKTSVAGTYKRALMLGCCKPNQMRQRDITHIYEATEIWSNHVSISHAGSAANFILNLSEDSAPAYSSLVSKEQSPFYRGINLTPLLALLKEYLVKKDSAQDSFSKGSVIPDSISKNLANYLIKAWEKLSERSVSRLPSNKSTKICVGFSATHYFLSGGVEFEAQLQRGGQKPAKANSLFASKDVSSVSQVTDVWAGSFDAEAISTLNPGAVINYRADAGNESIAASSLTTKSADHQKYNAHLLDISPNGYCIKWSDTVPDKIKTGEIIGINEQSDHTWMVGVIRWISQPSPHETIMGVELLASGAIPCGAKVLAQGQHKTDFMRALLLPSLDAMGQSASFIAPNMPFKENQSIILNQYGETSQGFLGECTHSTGSFSQFIFQSETHNSQLLGNNDHDDNVWPDI